MGRASHVRRMSVRKGDARACQVGKGRPQACGRRGQRSSRPHPGHRPPSQTPPTGRRPPQTLRASAPSTLRHPRRPPWSTLRHPGKPLADHRAQRSADLPDSAQTPQTPLQTCSPPLADPPADPRADDIAEGNHRRRCRLGTEILFGGRSRAAQQGAAKVCLPPRCAAKPKPGMSRQQKSRGMRVRLWCAI